MVHSTMIGDLHLHHLCAHQTTTVDAERENVRVSSELTGAICGPCVLLPPQMNDELLSDSVRNS